MLWNISVTTREVNLNNKPYSSITTWLCITNGVNTNILGVLLLRFPLGRVWFPSASDARVGMASARVLPDPVSVIPTTSLFRELCPFSGLVGWCSRIGQYYAWMVDGRLNLRTSVHLWMRRGLMENLDWADAKVTMMRIIPNTGPSPVVPSAPGRQQRRDHCCTFGRSVAANSLAPVRRRREIC